ncbi:MAG: FAD:protein FMN transferase [Cryomorphaceae bacterium]|nr:FAD:protein FMN transferase [Cryomorphaceae bacterium]
MLFIKQIILFFSLFFIISCDNNTYEYKSVRGNALGTTYSVIIETEIKESLIRKKIDSIFEVVNSSMSTYIDNSIISKVNISDKPIIVDQHFIKVFNTSKEIWSLSKGYFDPTAGSYVNLYGLGPDTKTELIDKSKIDSVKKIVGFEKVFLKDDNKIIKKNKNIFIDFNAIAKGYSVDLINDLFIKNNINNFLIEVGGEIITKGNAENKRGWKVAIQNPIEINSYYTEITLMNKSLATSGNYRKFRIDPNNGERYAHIINPLTGQSLFNNILSASVISDNCINSDAWATALMVMNPDIAQEIIDKIDGIEMLLLTSKNDQIFPIKSKGWDSNTK